MKTRDDLLHVAEVLAAQAREAVDDSSWRQPEALTCAQGTKAALEAAALVDADPAPLIAAIEDFHRRVNVADVEVSLLMGGPEAALDVIAGLVEHYRREVRIGAAVQVGYVELRDLLKGLVHDFDQADTDTARRIAQRIHTGLDSAHEAIEAAKREQEG